MRAVLICLQAHSEPQVPVVAGYSAPQRQLEFALRCGCDLVVAHGHGGGQAAIDLRHRAERAGARFQTIATAQALVGLIGEQDALLVLQPGLWPDCDAALAPLRSEKAILVVPAGPGQQAGFERIDLDRAWAGALVIGGGALARLDALPDDIAPSSALLRIALQQRLPESRLAAPLLDDGCWNVLHSPADARIFERKWLHRVAGAVRGSACSQKLASLVLLRRGGLLAAGAYAVPLLLLAVAIILAGAMLASLFGHGAACFALLALAAPVAQVLLGTLRLRAAPAAISRQWTALPWLCDTALAGCAVIAIGGVWYRAIFAALVLVVSLVLLDRHALPDRLLCLRDRGLAALAIALAACIVPIELAVMLIATAGLLANFAPRAKEIS